MVQGYASFVDLAPEQSVEQSGRGARRLLLQRWGTEASRRVAAMGAATARAKLRAVVADLTWPDPDRDAGSQAVVQHALALKRRGYRVEFVACEPADDMERACATLLQAGVEPAERSKFPTPESLLEARAGELDCVYFHRIQTHQRLGKLVRGACPGALVILNMADLQSLRMKRELEVRAAAMDSGAVAEMTASEARAMLECDVTIVHSSHEAELAATLAPGANVIVAPWALRANDAIAPFAARRGLAFVGGYRHSPNVDAALWFAERVFPEIRERLPDVELYLAGSHMPAQIMALAGPGIRPIGFVSDLEKFLGEIRLTVAPLRFGAGIKGKILSSLAAGAPCVTTKIGAEGFPKDVGLTVASDDPASFAETVAGIYGAEAAWNAASAQGRNYIATAYSNEAVDNVFGKLLAERERRAA